MSALPISFAVASNPEQAFQGAIAAAGLTPPDSIIADGKIRRFSTNGKGSDDAGWYILHLDNIPAGSFGNWREGRTNHGAVSSAMRRHQSNKNNTPRC